MGSDWSETTLGKLCDDGQARIQTGPFGSQLHAHDYEPTGVPVVPTEAIGRRRILGEGVPRVSRATAERLVRHKLKSGDILFARRGVQATGLSALVEAKHEGWLCGTGAILLRLETPDIHPMFLSYALSSDAIITWLKSHAVGAVMPNLNEGVLRRIPLSLPPPEEQRTIAHVLGALDDKIEFNLRMNETLEALAQTIFKNWFIDVTQDSIPKGWEEVELGNLLQFEKGKKPPTAFETSEVGLHPVILIETFDSGKSAFASPENMLEADSQDVLMVMDGASSGRVETGFAGLVGSTIAKIVPRRAVPGSRFLYYTLKQLEPETRQHLTGTSIPHTDKGWIVRQTVNLPLDEALIKRFEDVAASIRTKIELNLAESRTLAALRDALLPKLLSGAVRVSASVGLRRDETAAEKIVEDTI